MRNKRWAVTALLVLVGIAVGALGERRIHRCEEGQIASIAWANPNGQSGRVELETDLDEIVDRISSENIPPGTMVFVVKVGDKGAVFSMDDDARREK